MHSFFLPLPQLPRGEYVQVGKLPSWNKEIEGQRRTSVDEEDGRKGWSVRAEEAWGRGRDVNGTDIFRPYSNSIRSERVFIRPYPIPSIQYP